MRKLKDIKTDINQCQSQIAATYNNESYSTEDATITREGFQKQLAKLNTELQTTQNLRNLEVINPRLVRG